MFCGLLVAAGTYLVYCFILQIRSGKRAWPNSKYCPSNCHCRLSETAEDVVLVISGGMVIISGERIRDREANR